MVHYIST